ncbi:phosphohexomutase domain-containing protein [Solicola gregarius]|uniref:Phosphomannomutase/phosphoglucomutase n=1 Tax=Solicola gregarius TaxID=2908642 RepID=A0AA46TET6_9ACTN|nr:phosphomannomutase/phosphoglucomutase [Solicola gregarius]UYM04042.1 phosphomannomutase/phosphoglucomutase [Solicola gregarius]
MTPPTSARVDAVLKAYDVRGATPDPLDPELAAAYATAFAEHVDPGAERPIVLGRDLRTSSEPIAAAVADALTAAGWNVVDVGVCSTDLLYFGSGEHDTPGIMITASHNPARDNGMKFCRRGARPIGRDDGLAEVAERAKALLAGETIRIGPRGVRTPTDLSGQYADRLVGLAPVHGRRLRVVVDAANAVAGVTTPVVFELLPVDLVPLYFEPDGTFPHHEPNPLAPENLVDLQAAVRTHGADLGLAFDGDADRCFVVDETGAVVSGSAIACLIASRVLRDHPGATILHNLICSRSVPETITANGGVPVRTPVGHSLIKAEMARTGARFGGEHSGHFYFADFFLADSGMLAALHVLGALASADVPLSELLAPYDLYSASGEVNSTVADPVAAMRRVVDAYDGTDEIEVDRLDGVTVGHPGWWFNVRASNTEPVVRLNVEALDHASMEALRDEVLNLIRRA